MFCSFSKREAFVGIPSVADKMNYGVFLGKSTTKRQMDRTSKSKTSMRTFLGPQNVSGVARTVRWAGVTVHKHNNMIVEILNINKIII